MNFPYRTIYISIFGDLANKYGHVYGKWYNQFVYDPLASLVVLPGSRPITLNITTFLYMWPSIHKKLNYRKQPPISIIHPLKSCSMLIYPRQATAKYLQQVVEMANAF